MQSFLVPLYSFQISYVCLTDVSVFDAFILLPLYNREFFLISAKFPCDIHNR
jgi:hypothetical protein